MADVEKRLKEFNDGETAQVSVAELRELALQSMPPSSEACHVEPVNSTCS